MRDGEGLQIHAGKMDRSDGCAVRCCGLLRPPLYLRWCKGFVGACGRGTVCLVISSWSMICFLYGWRLLRAHESTYIPHRMHLTVVVPFQSCVNVLYIDKNWVPFRGSAQKYVRTWFTQNIFRVLQAIIGEAVIIIL